MDQAKLAALLSLEPEDRYWYSIDRIAETGTIWALHGDSGWLTQVAPEGFEYLPVWPDRALAQLLCDLRFPGQTPTGITLEEFRADWLDTLAGDAVRIGVFPDSEATFWPAEALEFHDTVDDAAQSRI